MQPSTIRSHKKHYWAGAGLWVGLNCSKCTLFLVLILFLSLAYTEGDELSIETYTLSQYQEEMKNKIPVKESGKQQEILQQEITQRERQMEERHQQELQQLRQQLERAREESHLEIRQRERMERQLQEMREELQRLHLEIQERDQRERRKERESQERKRRLEDTERRLQEREREFEERNRQAQEEIRQLRIENEERERQFQEREQLLQEQLRQSEQDLQEKQDQLEQQQSSWVLNEEITMTDNVLGNGGYGEVRVGLFRGLRVAAKRLHQIILSPYNRGVFCREMEIASKVRHPNLLQFIGATREGNPIILTELMPTSLRKELETGTPLPHTTILNISLDIACALNYLHLFKPHPILHRDISSGNVLLQPTFFMGIGWRAKVSDYGSANLQNLIATTANPGNRVYSAPEAGNPREHSPAMDVFSYGVLLIETSICSIPQPDNRRRDINSIRRPAFKGLVQRCVMDNYRLRPKMSEIINELNHTI